MKYIQSEKHFIGYCSKIVRTYGIGFTNYGTFVNDLQYIYQLSEEIESLTVGASLADIITWQISHECSSKEDILSFLKETLPKIIEEAENIYSRKLDFKFVYLHPVVKENQIVYKPLVFQKDVQKDIPEEEIKAPSKVWNKETI